MRAIRVLVATLLVAAAVAACGADGEGTPPQALTGRIDPGTSTVPVRTVEVLDTIPHSEGSWTEGLVFDGGHLYESTGIQRASTLKEIDPASGDVLHITNLSMEFYGEGLAKVDDRFVQLTWKNGTALEWDAATFEPVGTHDYSGEGWGLCFDGKRLVMSNGSSSLTFRDPKTFASTGSVKVTLDGEAVPELNELECVGDRVYANVWQTNRIVEIDPDNGKVVGLIDASGLLNPAEDATADVLNGIAYDPTDRSFWLTGKLWPHLFRVRLVQATKPLPAAPTTIRG